MDNAIIYASTIQEGNWNTRLIYNPDNNKWYTGSNNIQVMNSTWDDIWTQMQANNWKPVEYSE